MSFSSGSVESVSIQTNVDPIIMKPVAKTVREQQQTNKIEKFR